jgi:putative membrane protein
MKYLLRFLIISLVIFALPYVFSGIKVGSFGVAVIVALVLAGLNVLVKPVVSLLTLPINMLTLGTFGLVLNGFFFWLSARFVEGFSVDGFLSAFLGALVVSVISWILNR